jgi:hypothetical protein
MGASNIQDQEGNVVPPRLGAICVIAVTATSEGYDLTSLKFPDERPNVPGSAGVANQIWLTLENTGSSPVFFVLDSAVVGTNTISDTATTSAGSAITFVSGGCASVQAAPDRRDVRIDRQVDRTLIVKCSSGNTSTLRVTISSQSLPGATQGS